MGQARQGAEGQAPSLIGPVVVRDRLWFNEADDSHYFLVPGLIVLIMTLIGSFLTAMVMAREWERGTLEALFVTPVRSDEILLGKTIPYFLLGMIGLSASACFAARVPVQGAAARVGVGAYGRGIDALPTRHAGHRAFGVDRRPAASSWRVRSRCSASFMPAMMLSGFLFDLQQHADGGAA